MSSIDFEHIDLDALRAEADGKYKNLVVQGVVFRGPMRLSKDERAEFVRLLSERREGEVSDVTEFYRGILTLVAEDKDAATGLLNQVGDDAAVLDTLVSLYFERTQAGEA